MVTQIRTRKVRLSVTVNPELKALAEEVADESNTTPSGVVSRCLEELARNRKKALMIQYYDTMANEHEELTQKSIPVIQKIAASWGD